MIFYTLNHYGFIQVSGPDACTFLQGQLTCDVNAISSQQSHFSGRCTPQGRVVSVFRLFSYQDQFYLRLPKIMLPILLASLKKYAVFSKVVIEDVTTAWQALGCYQPDAKLFPALPQQTDAAIPLDHGSLIKVSGEDRYEYYVKPTESDTLLADHSIQQEDDWHRQNIQLGIPEVYPETMEQFTAHDLDLPAFNAVSFTKGCYSGQEIIARTHYRATLKHHLYQARLAAPQPLGYGTPIKHDETTVGHLVDFVVANDEVFLLVLLRDDAADKKVLIADTIISSLVRAM